VKNATTFVIVCLPAFKGVRISCEIYLTKVRFDSRASYWYDQQSEEEEEETMSRRKGRSVISKSNHRSSAMTEA
jgi:hypothetical protein